MTWAIYPAELLEENLMFHISSSRQNNLVVGALALVTVLLMLTSLYCLRNRDELKEHKISELEVIYKQPLPGHWLKTEEAPVEYKEAALKNSEVSENTERLEEAQVFLGKNTEIFETSNRHLNREMDAINVLNLWTDKGKLKVVSITTLNRTSKKPAVVVISLATAMNEKGQTLQEFYQEKGLDNLRKELEKKFEVSLHNYVHIDHKALYALSDMLGPLKLQEEEVTMARALEESVEGTRRNDDSIVREVAKKVIHPVTWIKLPSILKVFKDHFKSSLEIGEILHILNYARQLRLEDTQKTVLPGKVIFLEGRHCKIVKQDTWQNILYEATR